MTSPNKSTGLLTASTVISKDKGILAGFQIITDGGSNTDATLIVYDNKEAVASGTVLAKITVTSTDDSLPINMPLDGVGAKTGLYAVLSVLNAGTAEFIVFWR